MLLEGRIEVSSQFDREEGGLLFDEFSVEMGCFEGRLLLNIMEELGCGACSKFLCGAKRGSDG